MSALNIAVVRETAGTSVHVDGVVIGPLNDREARRVAMGLLEASTTVRRSERELRRHVAVDERLRDLEGGV